MSAGGTESLEDITVASKNQHNSDSTPHTTQPNPKSRKDLWTLIKESKDHDKKNSEGNATLETTIYVVGSKGSGKSSMILGFLDRDETPSPSVALEYTFGRRTRGVNSTKDVVHIWELAGGIYLSDLLEIPITESNIHVSTFLIVLDLSNPSTILDTLEPLLDKIKTKVNKVLDGLEQRGSKRPKVLRNAATKRYGVDHPDIDLVTLSPVPITIIGSKYDEMQSMESEMRKMLCKMLRYMAHINGASLIFVSQKDDTLASRSRHMMSYHGFKSNAPKSMVMDHNKPILIMAGQDTFCGIGLPPSEISKNTIGQRTFIPLEKWKSDYIVYFPKPKVQVVQDRIDLSKFPEHAIDVVRVQKDEELERLRRANDRKMKDKDTLGDMASLTLAGSGKEQKKKGKSYSRANASLMSVA
ncbi:hypothetical protein BDV3_005158 [Batrachochytrium dendrobatidis]|uniref:Cytoplasmic dynein 2 light intermediate chain 1 n=1 Tax=Batrachochytrium dendrobatidis (strain JEL423) TaxID=403673 RepID=A0A177WLZ2_BATDL|nr:hypothetical protein BDEG_24410 [Batrachochytrium dendrobatidis JEL423]